MTPVVVYIIYSVVFEFSKKLPNGYRVAYNDSSTAFVLDSAGDIVVGPHVSDWATIDDLVFGIWQDEGVEYLFVIDTRGQEWLASRNHGVITSFATSRGARQADIAEVTAALLTP